MQQSKESYRTGEHALNLEESQALLAACNDFTEYVFLRLAINTGIRRSDIVTITWKDVDFENNRISFYESKKRRVKEVYLSESMLQDLRRLESTQNKEHYLFCGSSNKKYGKGHLSSRTAYNILQRNLKSAGLEQRPFHSLRATCVKLCQSRGWTAAETAKHIGDTIRVVQEHYATPSHSEMKNVAIQKNIL